jgi:hypothetical protein
VSREETQFKSGESGNNAGRPKGSKNKMTVEIKAVVDKILNYINDDEQLQVILDDIKNNKPEVYLNFVAKLAPKDLNVKTDIAKNPLLEKLAKFDVSEDDKTDIS